MGPDGIPGNRSLDIFKRLRTTLLLTALLVFSAGVSPSFALTEDCTFCHGTFAEIHGSVDHTATPASGTVAIFADNGHDDAGWYGEKPYFGVLVDCGTCHASDLLAIHAENCWTCHSTPYDTLEKNWGGGCQQGGCHTAYHADINTAHLPFEDPYDPGNDCYSCHDSSWNVPQSKCLTCHATYGSGDGTPPVTSTDAKASYEGPARIVFSISDNGKVGIGTTFYRLDGGDTTAGSQVIVSAPGLHNLEFWSVDQAGNTESPKWVEFTTVEDTIPPATTSDARSSYSQGAVINLTATDNSTLGVKNTFFKLDDGPVQTGTRVEIPAISGVITYVLTFWSEDWSGNSELPNSVTFTVTSGSGTLRLVWGNSDASGSPCPGDPEANASWTVWRGGYWGSVVATGSGSCPGWSGIDDVLVPVGSTSYLVRIRWWDSYFGFYDETDFANVYVTTPGEVIRLSY